MPNENALYMQLAATLMADISSGRYKVGEVLPTETELCESEGLSRATVRSALGVLVENQVIQRRAGVGSVVLARTPVPTHGQWTTVRNLLEQGPTHRQEVLDVRMAALSAALAKVVGAPEGEGWLEVTVLRYEKDQTAPYNHSTVYVNPKYAKKVGEAIQPGARGRYRGPIYQLIEKSQGVQTKEVEQAISAVSLTKAIAEKLGVRAATPGLRIVRKYVSAGGEVVELSLNEFAAGYEYLDRLAIG